MIFNSGKEALTKQFFKTDTDRQADVYSCLVQCKIGLLLLHNQLNVVNQYLEGDWLIAAAGAGSAVSGALTNPSHGQIKKMLQSQSSAIQLLYVIKSSLPFLTFNLGLLIKCNILKHATQNRSLSSSFRSICFIHMTLSPEGKVLFLESRGFNKKDYFLSEIFNFWLCSNS